MHSYMHNIKTFNSATRHLTRVERSIYRDMIEMYYDTEQPLPANDFLRLCRSLLVVTDEEKTALKYVLCEYFVRTGDVYTHDFCDEKIDEYKRTLTSKAIAGKASAAAKKAKASKRRNTRTAGVEQVLDERSADVCNQKPETINHNINNNNNIITSSREPIAIEDWQLSDEVLQLIEDNHCPCLFAESLSDEFRLFWRGQFADNWDSKFINQTINQWSSNVGESWRRINFWGRRA